MKKILLTSMVLFLAISLSANGFGFGKKNTPTPDKAQKTSMYTVGEGDFIVSLGYGAPNWSKMIFSVSTGVIDLKDSYLGPLHLKGEYMVGDFFGIGLVVNHVSTNLEYKLNDGFGGQYNYKIDYASTAFNVRFNWHFYNQQNFDIYAGGGVGYRVGNTKIEASDPTYDTEMSFGNFPLGLEFSGGIRYYVTDMIGFYMEVGATKSIVQGGVTLKF